MVKEINIGGKNRPVHFGMNALDIFEEKTGIKFTNIISLINDGMTMGQLISFVYAGLEGGRLKTNSEDRFTRTEVGDWIDDYGIENMQELTMIYLDAMPMIKDEDKKKAETLMKKVS
jgi:hypothetical protein